jgi:hypothetical protein
MNESEIHSPDERFQQESAASEAALTLHFAFYNFCRVHQFAEKNAGMAAGITDDVWDVAELFTL